MNKISRADRILIMGPGETKEQLSKAIGQHNYLSGRIIMVETVDKLTQKQIAARVRDFYEIDSVKSLLEGRRK
jgi:hypothetical protein